MQLKKPLAAKERLFCAAYARLPLPQEAAVAAGYPAKKAGAIALGLLGREDIRLAVEEELRHAPEQGLLRELVKQGLVRLAFSSPQDAARLLDPPAEGEAGQPLDLFGVSEIKSGKNGVEIKFADRQRALETLWEIAKAEAPAKEGAIYQALLESAQALKAHERD